MHLVAPLAAGVTGAENGTAEIYLRGTATRASYWLDFEGTNLIPTGADVVLDSHGGGVVYVRELCSIVVKTIGGAVLRDFVAGDRDDSVEVLSESFTGVGYGGGSAALNNETTLASVLDRWLLVNGGSDWGVGLPGGGSSSISQAIAGSYGLVYSVIAYGAAGDGITMDTNAISAAIAAANAAGGGIVYLPPGTYRTTGNHTVPGDVSLIGAGRATEIVLDSAVAATVFLTTSGSSAECWQMIAGMHIRAAIASPSGVIGMQTNCQAACSNLYVDGTNFPGTLIISDAGPASQLLVTGCTFRLNSASRVVDTPSANFKRLLMRDCRFITPAVYTNNTVIDANLFDIQACVFDNAATTTGTYHCVRSSAATLSWRISGCRFSSAAGATVTALGLGTYAAASNVVESDNIFGTGITAYSYTATAAARGAQIHLRSRESRSIFITDNGAAPVLPIRQYGLVVLSSTNTAIVFAPDGMPPDGSRGTIVVFTPGTITGTAIAGAGFVGQASIVTSNDRAYAWEYRICTANTTVQAALTVDGRNLGIV